MVRTAVYNQTKAKQGKICAILGLHSTVIPYNFQIGERDHGGKAECVGGG